MILVQRDGYLAQKLRSGDIVVTKGAWILLRHSPGKHTTKIINGEGPLEWYPEAQQILQDALKDL